MNKPDKLLILDSNIFIHHPSPIQFPVCLRPVQLLDRFKTMLTACKNAQIAKNLALVLVLSKQYNNCYSIAKWLKADMPGITGHETDTMSQSFMGYRLPCHQGDSLPANSPPRNDLATNVLATKRSLLATNHQ